MRIFRSIYQRMFEKVSSQITKRGKLLINGARLENFACGVVRQELLKKRNEEAPQLVDFLYCARFQMDMVQKKWQIPVEAGFPFL